MKLTDKEINECNTFRCEIKHKLDSKQYNKHITRNFCKQTFFNFKKGRNLTERKLNELKKVHYEF